MPVAKHNISFAEHDISIANRDISVAEYDVSVAKHGMSVATNGTFVVKCRAGDNLHPLGMLNVNVGITVVVPRGATTVEVRAHTRKELCGTVNGIRPITSFGPMSGQSFCLLESTDK